MSPDIIFHDAYFYFIQEERLKEKKENEMQRAKILQQIAQDRADRQKQFAPIPATTSKPG